MDIWHKLILLEVGVRRIWDSDAISPAISV